MDPSAASGAARFGIKDAHRIHAVPWQFIKPAPTELARLLVGTIDDIVRPAAFVESDGDFQRYVAKHIGDFMALAMALGTQGGVPVEPMPHIDVGPRLVDLLGGGADEELEFCEATLWSVLRRSADLKSGVEEGMRERERELDARSLGWFMSGLFCWAVLGEAEHLNAHPTAMGCALRCLRESSLLAYRATEEAIAMRSTEAIELGVTYFDAEDIALAMDADP